MHLRRFPSYLQSPPSISLYEKLGFEIEGTYRCFAVRGGEATANSSTSIRWPALGSEAAVAYPSSRLALTRISTLPLKALDTGQP